MPECAHADVVPTEIGTFVCRDCQCEYALDGTLRYDMLADSGVPFSEEDIAVQHTVLWRKRSDGLGYFVECTDCRELHVVFTARQVQRWSRDHECSANYAAQLAWAS